MSACAVALDLGSTRIKAARLERGRLAGIESEAAPELLGTGELREGDPLAYREAAERVLRRAARGLPAGTPLGLASQRSSLVLWRRDSGEPVTPLISWQDRRAAAWCREHASSADAVQRATGLLLSAHYAGPKLAALRAARPELGRALDAGELAFGNLDAWMLWHWTDGRVHETDVTMAARTLMFDLDLGDWSGPLLALYGVPRSALPRVRPTGGRRVELSCGLALSASVADQAAGALAILRPGNDSVLITLGTGAFVLRPLDGGAERRPGYLTAPVLGRADGAHRWVLEGTINGAGAALDRFPGGATDWTGADPSPEAFCIPDVAGLGSPWFRPEIGLTFSSSAAALDVASQRRTVVEGLLFRLAQVLGDLCPEPPRRVLLSGGVAAEAALVRGLAGLLGRPVELLEEAEAGLTGAARLAAGLEPWTDPAATSVSPDPSLGWLRAKYPRWRAWVAERLEAAR